MAFRWHPAVAITASRLLRAELRIVEQHAGWDFEYTESIPDGRRYASCRPLIIVGADVVARVRNRMSCRGFVVVATANPDSRQTFAHAGRIGASYLIVLPGARPWLAHRLLHDVSELIRHGRPTRRDPAPPGDGCAPPTRPVSGQLPPQDVGA